MNDAGGLTHASPGPLQSITAQAATHKLCMMGAPCAGGSASHRAYLHAHLAAQDHKRKALCCLTLSDCSSAGDPSQEKDHQPAGHLRLSSCAPVCLQRLTLVSVPAQTEGQPALMCLFLQRMIQVMRTPRCRTPISCWARGQLLSTLPTKQLEQPWGRGTGRMRGDRPWRWRLWVSAGNDLMLCPAMPATPAVSAS